MKRFTRLAAVMAGLLLVTAGSQAVYATCTSNSAVFPVFQCGFRSWFAPAPSGAGDVSAVWWQVGYGNNTVATGTSGGALEGTAVGPAGVFSGNDNGQFAPILTEARVALPQHASQIPAGAKCLNYENSWGAAGVDGCADDLRTTSGSDNDDKLNIYYDPTYGPGNYSTYNLIDYPMAVLLTESSNQFFAVAFVANRQRGTDQASRANDFSEGFFDLGEVTNGDVNPVTAQNDIVSWQAIPKQRVDATTFSNPADKLNSDRILALSWPAVTQHSDGSVRPSGRTLSNPGNGVGVMDQGPLIRYIVESTPITSATPDPGAVWSALATTTSNTANVTVPPDTAIRLRTAFGKSPATSAFSLTNAREGKMGDIGYSVVSGHTIIAGPLVAERAVDTVAAKNKNTVTVSFRTTSEISVTGIEILGKGDAVLKTIAPKGTGGGGASYTETLSVAELKGSKELKVRLNGPNTTTGAFPIQ